ncbi:2TM domain-containing protein [Dyadobacter sp. SG02]|uniref:2TM domain-containing protein n=1 Tax=Dyadobacter sp. SG02 TaxID=1855291 RepID=UPI0008B702B4|nr:2TM domain-containing protein [Dyadobacter sp. SG02]SEI53546.1 2TM domain-containing protein [Dyadobacter sp. SG02]
MKNQKHMAAMYPINQTKGFRIHLLVFLLTIPAIWIIWYFTDRTYLWPFWQTAAWTVGVFFHYLGVFVFKKTKTIKYLPA